MGSQRHGVPVTKKQIDKAVQAFGGGKKKRKGESAEKKPSTGAASK